MPLYKKIVNENGFIIVWKIDPEEKELLNSSKLFLSEKLYLQNITNINRRTEWLIWHNLVRKYIGKYEVSYDNTGAPYLIGADTFISVSHCKDYIAIFFNYFKKCGVDIEVISRDISPLFPKFVSTKESVLLRNNPLLLLWCSKEAAFKLSGAKDVDFKNDLAITCIEENKITMNFFTKYSSTLSFFKDENIILVYR